MPNRSNEAVNKIIEVFNIINPSDCLLILSSGDLGTTSPLRKFFETKTDDLISFPCYEDEDKTLQQFITDYLKENGISKIDTDAIKFLINNLGSNRELTKNELDKLNIQETNIQNRIDQHITEYLDCIRRKI